MELINIREHSLKYRTHTQIESALAWNALKKFLEENNKMSLYPFVSAVKITEKNITIFVSKSIVKNEFSLLKEPLGKYLQKTLSESYGSHHRTFKIL